MHHYIGTKEIQAESEDRDGVIGYAVVYADGYRSWSPASAFTGAYRLAEGQFPCLTFGDAVFYLKQGKRMARAGWNGQGMFVFLVPGSHFTVNRAPLLGIYPAGTEIDYMAHIDIKRVDGSIATWAPSNGDVLAEDWLIIE